MLTLSTTRDPVRSFRAPQAFHDALAARARARGLNRSQLIRATLCAAFPELSTGVSPGNTSLPSYARSYDSREHTVFEGRKQNQTYKKTNLDREAITETAKLAEVIPEPLSVPAQDVPLSKPAPEALRVGDPTPPTPPGSRRSTPPKAEAPHVSAPRYSGAIRPWHSEWTESARQRKARLRLVVAAVLEHGDLEQGQLERNRKMGADFGETEKLAARIYHHALSLDKSVYWMRPTPELGVALWTELCDAARELPKWETWKAGFEAWSSHAAQDDPIAEAGIKSLWRIIDRPKKYPGHPTNRERIEGAPRFIEAFAKHRYVSWCNPTELVFYGSAEKRHEVRSSVQVDLAIEVEEIVVPVEEIVVRTEEIVVRVEDIEPQDCAAPETITPSPNSYSHSSKDNRGPDPVFMAELRSVKRTAQEREARTLASMGGGELANLVRRLENGRRSQLQSGCEIHPAFLNRIERAKAALVERSL